MKHLKKALMWYILLHKRLFKKAGFLMALALIPVFALAVGLIAQQESGILHVALAAESSGDPAAMQAINELRQGTNLIQYIVCDSPDGAEEYVKTGKADSAWIFGEDFGQLLADRFMRKTEQPVVRILEREDTALLRILHEKLFGQLFKAGSKTVYLQFVRQQVPELASYSDQQLFEYYDSVQMGENLFSFSYMNGEKAENNAGANYLLLPVRGLLSVLVVLTGLAAALYYIRDEEQGTFSWISFRVKPFAALGVQFIPIAIAAVVMLLSLFFSRLTISLSRELLCLALFVLCCTGFCSLVRLLCKGMKPLAMLLPLAAVVMIAVCPVFMDFTELRPVQMLFPPYYYINGMHSDAALLQMALYAVVTITGYLMLSRLTRRT